MADHGLPKDHPDHQKVVSTAKEEAKKQSKHTRLRALFDYEAGEEDELSLRVYQEYVGIRLLEPEGHWWYGKTLDGSKSGIFPANYVEIIKSDADASNGGANGGSGAARNGTASTTNNPIAMASAGASATSGLSVEKPAEEGDATSLKPSCCSCCTVS
jgi:hypothetical protein